MICIMSYPPLRPSCNTRVAIGFAVDTLGVLMHKVNVENTYEGDPFLVTVADYDADFTADPSYDDYGIVYNDRLQVNMQHMYNLLQTNFGGATPSELVPRLPLVKFLDASKCMKRNTSDDRKANHSDIPSFHTPMASLFSTETFLSRLF